MRLIKSIILSLNKVVDYEKLPFVAPVLLYIMGRTGPPKKRGSVGCVLILSFQSGFRFEI